MSSDFSEIRTIKKPVAGGARQSKGEDADLMDSDLQREVDAALSGMSMDELDEALEELGKQGWLTRTDGQDVVYRVSFHRKTTSKLSQNIWSALESKNGRMRDVRQDDKTVHGNGPNRQ